MGTCVISGFNADVNDTFSSHVIRAVQITKVLPIVIIGCHAKRQKKKKKNRTWNSQEAITAFHLAVIPRHYVDL